VDEYGAPRYPELVLVTGDETGREAEALAAAIAAGYELATEDPGSALNALLDANPELDRTAQETQLDALLDADAFSPPGRFDRAELRRWAAWDVEHGILENPIPPRELLAP
jgi:ABC-type nitrate/sulfonate/bicarbonate transport system substrate-binding protein